MSSLLITNVSCVLPESIVSEQAVFCRDGKIVQIGTQSDITKKVNGQIDQTVDGHAGYLTPGFIDLHIHGLQHYHVQAGADALTQMSSLLCQYGVTGFLPTVCPRSIDEDVLLLRQLAQVKTTGAEILGFHLEGPFLTLAGAIPPQTRKPACDDVTRNLIEAAKPYKTIFSISPDFPDIHKVIPTMKQNGGPVFITHTAANVEQTKAAIEAGASHATHFYDVFNAPEQTEPGVRPCGVVEAVMADDRVSVDFILDGIHVDPIAVQMALACKAPDRVCLITDAMVGATLPPGTYDFMGDTVEIAAEGAPARMAPGSRLPGALYGSGLTMDRALRNALQMLNIDLPQALRMTSTNPAKVLGLDNRIGKIEPGYDANLVLLDHSLQVVKTWIGGTNRFTR